MKRKPPRRIYLVQSSDFPIEVEVEAQNLADCQVAVGDVFVMRNGAKVGRVALQLEPPLSQAALKRRFTYADPQQDHDAGHVSMILSFATAANPSTAKYKITLTAASGDVEVTTVVHPVDEEDTTATIKFTHV